MSKNLEADSGNDAQEDRLIDSYIQKAVDAGEIDPGELNAGSRSIFWDRNTVRAAVIGVIVLIVVNMVFFYTMRIGESDNSTQWELSKRDFLIEYRESRLKSDNQQQPTSELNPASFDDLQNTVIDGEQPEPATVTEAIPLEEVSNEVSSSAEEVPAVAEVSEIPGPVLPESGSPAEAVNTEAAYVPEESQGEMAAADEASIRDFVQSWAQAWSFQNVDAYLSHYSEDFISQGGAPFGPWSELRSERLTVPEWIHVIVDDMRVLVDQDLAVAEFIQVYTASNYSDDSRKTLVLQNESGQWKILEETSAPLD